ncbi:hypothetical protein N7454_008974 [Penicillium verhagenii]|nr:hypothetical protein N7454_008974 [Penicillium verhagenii]
MDLALHRRFRGWTEYPPRGPRPGPSLVPENRTASFAQEGGGGKEEGSPFSRHRAKHQEWDYLDRRYTIGLFRHRSPSFDLREGHLNIAMALPGINKLAFAKIALRGLSLIPDRAP